MAERISAEQFQASAGVAQWTWGARGVEAHFATGSFARGVELVDVIGRLADAANHHPDVDLRYPRVTVRLFTHDVDGISDLDVELAQQISVAAWELGIQTDPHAA